MKRVAAFAVTLIVVFLIGMAAVPFFASGKFLKSRIEGHIAALTGRPVTISGNPTLSLYPHVSVSVDDIIVSGSEDGGTDHALMQADGLRAALRPLPLLLGNIEFEDFELNRPVIRLINRKEGGPNWLLTGSTLAQTPPATGNTDRQLSPKTEVPVGRVRINDGTIVIEDRVNEWREEMTDVDLDLTWPDARSSLRGSGHLVWRNVPVDFNGSIGSPVDVIVGGSSPMRFAAASVTARIAFNGTVENTDTLSLEGVTSVATPSLRATIDWLGTDAGTGAILGPAAIRGNMRWQGAHVSFERAGVEMDGNSADGALSLVLSGDRPHLTADLTAGTLDLTPYVEAARGDLISREPWLLSPAQLPFTHFMDANIHLRADQLIIGSARTGEFDGIVKMQRGDLELIVTDTQFYGGALEGQLNASTADSVMTIEAQARLDRVPAGVALRDTSGITALDGRASLSFHASAEGRSWGELLRAANGGGQTQIRDGVLYGFDLPQVADAIANPLAEIMPGSTQTGFYDLTARYVLRDGTLWTDDLSITGSGYRMTLTGRGSLVTGQVDATALLSTRTTDAPLAIVGRWQTPVVFRDLERPRPATSLMEEGEGG